MTVEILMAKEVIVRNVKTKKRGEFLGKFIDMTGKRVGKLKVLKRVPPPDGAYDKNKAHWLCQCDCGNKKVILGYHLRKKNPTESCGCKRIEVISTHGMTHSRFYNIWLGIKSRCYYEGSTEFSSYGSRGIKMSDSWKCNFENFYDDMYESYEYHVKKFGEKDTTIERIDVNGNYTKNNCRWATIYEQNRNRRDNKSFKAISPNDEVYYSNCQKDFALKFGLYPSNITHCLKGDYKQYKGWKFEYI